ncbi:MAG: hypothetical protein HQK96_03400 [Nitrospirae bacterium]|nr:hypothetical protein [Nitrospirota bacterium]MBF0553585.1 hypothetical protein [Nitrospirota bacterium]
MTQSEEKQLIISLATSNMSKIKKLFPNNKEISWLYFAEDFSRLCKIEYELGEKFKRIDITRILNDVSNDIRHDFMAWMDDINKLNGHNIEWWFGNISSRDIDTSNLFRYCCYIDVIERLWQKNDEVPKLIFIESVVFVKLFKVWALKRNISVQFINPIIFVYETFNKYVRYVLNLVSSVLRMSNRFISAYISKVGQKANKVNNPFVIIDTFIYSNSLSDNGNFNDRYYPYLYDYLSEKGISIAVHPIFVDMRYFYLSIYKKIRKSKNFFIIKEDYLTIYDYLFALGYLLRSPFRNINSKPFRNLDISIIMKEDNLNSWMAIEAILIYRLFIKFAKINFHFDLLINWYENQVLDRALIAATRKAFPDIKVVGVQMFIHTPNILNLYPIQSEIDAGITPHILLEMSNNNIEKALTYTKNIKCKVCASLRYSHLFQTNNNTDHDVKGKGKIILVLLPGFIFESMEILENVYKCIRVIDYHRIIHIKPHHSFNPKTIIRMFGSKRWPQNFKIYTGKLEDIFKQADVVISAHTSAIVEAVIYGIPVICTMRQTTLNHNMLYGLDIEFVSEVFTYVEMGEKLNQYLNVSDKKREEFRITGTKIRAMYFTPVNKETMNSFIESISETIESANMARSH